MIEPKPDLERLSDLELARLAACRHPGAVRLITTRNNQRLFRAAWSVLRNNADAEDAVQDAYLKAFHNMESFSGAASLSSWLTRIAINTALDRKRAGDRRRTELISQDVAMLDEYRAKYAKNMVESPEDALVRTQLGRLLKFVIAELPDDYRSVYVLRDIEEMSVRETAETLGLSEDVVKTRLRRARQKLRDALAPDIQNILRDTLAFAGVDCERMTARICEVLEIPSL